jgi:hypothetical protein
MKNRVYARVGVGSCLVFVSVGAVMLQPAVLDFKINTYPGPSPGPSPATRVATRVAGT